MVCLATTNWTKCDIFKRGYLGRWPPEFTFNEFDLNDMRMRYKPRGLQIHIYTWEIVCRLHKTAPLTKRTRHFLFELSVIVTINYVTSLASTHINFVWPRNRETHLRIITTKPWTSYKTNRRHCYNDYRLMKCVLLIV